MKKLLLLCTALFAINSLKAQTVNDTLRYFLYKQKYKLATSANTVHPYYKSNAMVNTNTFITHVGSIFKNTDTNLIVTGLEGRVLQPNTVFSTHGVAMRIYLCNISSLTGLPVLPPVDSISGTAFATASGSIFAGGPLWSQEGQYIGNSFATPHVMKGDFAVVARTTSAHDGDTVKIFRTAAYTRTATNAPDAWNKFGEGFGVLRDGGIWHHTTNYNHPDFGPGTDFEFCLAPMVQFSLQVSQEASDTQQGACEFEVFTNTNTSSPEFVNRQFNFDEFYREWAPNPQGPFDYTNFTPDSVLTWDMGDGGPPFYLFPKSDTIHLAYESGVSNTFFNGTITGKYKQAAYNTDAPTIPVVTTFSASTVWCYDTAGTGIHEIGQLANIKVYPNPTLDKTTLTGLQGQNTINIYDMMGQLVATEVTDESTHLVNMQKFPQGNYVLKIENQRQNNRFIKILKE